MREVVFLAWCDLCNREGRGRVEATEIYTIGIVRGENRPALRVLEVCDNCKLLVTELLGVLAENSAPLDPAALKGKNGKLKPPVEPGPVLPRQSQPALVEIARPSNYDAGDTVPCKVCHRAMHKSSIVTHVWSVHRKGEARPEVPTSCPDCGETFERPNAMGAHRSMAHGFSAVAEAYRDLVEVEV